MRFAVCNEIFQGWTPERVLEFAASIGLDGVEIAPYTLAADVREISAQRRKRLAAASQATGVEIVGLHWLLVGPEGMHINSPDASTRWRTQEYLRALTDFCAEIGGWHMVVGSPKQRNVLPGVAEQDAWRWALETMSAAADYAKAARVVLGMEPLSPQETNFLNTAEQTRRLVDEIARPALRMTLDMLAMSSEATPMPEIVSASKGYVSHVHANDSTRREPGSGTFDFSALAKALRGIGYAGYVSMEPFEVQPDPETMTRRGLQHLRQCFA